MSFVYLSRSSSVIFLFKVFYFIALGSSKYIPMKNPIRASSLLFIILFISGFAKAQLKNTKWLGKLNVPDETTVILHFRTDSVDMIIYDQGIIGESMTYSLQDNVITMKKTSGHSPCNIGDVFKLSFKIVDDKLFIKNLSDPCDERTVAWTDQPLIRVNK